MKTLKILAGLLLAMVFATPAFAQQSWSGPYAGINVDYGQGQYKKTWEYGGIPYSRDQTNVYGALFGAQWGYNHQFGKMVVVGLETDVQKGSMNGSQTTNLCLGCTDFTDVLKDTTRVNWFGTTRVRIGYPIGRLLPYVTGGVAYGSVNRSRREDLVYPSRPSLSFGVSSSESQTAVGGVYGVGLEYALTGNWRVRGEYLRVKLGVFKSQSGSSSQEVDLKSNVFRLAANYSF